MSAAFFEINRLKVTNIEYVCNEGDDTSTAVEIITTPHSTKVNVVTIGSDDITTSHLIKCFSVKDKECRYFLLDKFKTREISSSGEDYLRAEKYTHVEICLQTFPTVKNC